MPARKKRRVPSDSVVAVKHPGCGGVLEAVFVGATVSWRLDRCVADGRPVLDLAHIEALEEPAADLSRAEATLPCVGLWCLRCDEEVDPADVGMKPEWFPRMIEAAAAVRPWPTSGLRGDDLAAEVARRWKRRRTAAKSKPKPGSKAK